MQCKSTKFFLVTLSCIRFKSPTFFSCQIWTAISCITSLSMHEFTSANKSLPVVVPFIDRKAASSSVISKSFIIPHRNISNWDVSQTSQLLSRAKKKKSKLSQISDFPRCCRLISLRFAWRAAHSKIPLFCPGILALSPPKII